MSKENSVKTNSKDRVTDPSLAKNQQPKKRKRINTRPKDFKDFEVLAKTILENKEMSYFEWLHEQHEKLVLDFTVANQKEIAELVRKDD